MVSRTDSPEVANQFEDGIFGSIGQPTSSPDAVSFNQNIYDPSTSLIS